MNNVRRPKPGEDDLEEMMKQFEADKTAPSVTIVNKRANNEPKKKSLFSQKREAEKQAQKKADNKENIKFEIPDSADGHDIVLSEIVEKNTSVGVSLTAKPPSLPSSNQATKHFPDVIKIVDVDQKTEKTGKRSLFSQQFQQMKQTLSHQAQPSAADSNQVNVGCFGDSSRILSGSGLETKEDIASIHEDNLKILSQMSEQDILEEKEKLEKNIDAGLLEFLKNRKTKKVSFSKANQETVNKIIEPFETVNDNDLPKIDNVKVEKEKLQWMGEMPSVKPGQLSGFSARFGFDGGLLRPDSDVPVTAGLHHHGEDQEQPGYSVQEMMTLCQSSSNRQRQLGLELVEAVLTRWWSGELDSCLEQNLVTEMVGAGMVQVIRISLDSTETGVVMAAVKCLVSLLCCNEEERLLDWMVDMVQPGLAPVMDTVDNNDETEQDITDHQLVMSDVVLGLMRMDVLDRLWYLMTVERERYSDSVMVTGVLGVMVRMVRHSADLATRVSGHKLLQHMVSSHWPHPLCVKMLRCVVSWDAELAGLMVSQHNIVTLLTTQLARDNVDSLYSTQVSVECHKLWCALLAHGEAGQLWSQLYPIMVSRLVSLYNTDQVTSTSCVGAWIVMATCLNPDTSADTCLLLENCIRKWLTQLSTCQELPSPTFLQLVSVSCQCLVSLYEKHGSTGDGLTQSLVTFLNSAFYQHCLTRMLTTSCYLTTTPPSSRHPQCLPAVGILLHDGHPHPLLTHESPDILLSGVLTLANSIMSSPSNTSCYYSSDVQKILTKLNQSPVPNLTSHWLSRQSSVLFYNLLTFYSSTLSPDLQVSSAMTISTLLHCTQADKLHNILAKYLFNSSLLSSLTPPPPSLPPLPSPSGATENPEMIVKESLSQLPQLGDNYCSLLGVRSTPVKRSVVSINSGSKLSLDWPYLPLLSLYNSNTKTVTPDMVKHTLCWLSLLPHPPAPPTQSWAYLATVFLCPGTLYLSPDISSLLHLNLVKSLISGNIDLNQSIPGISSNADFYGQLLDQFMSESYGDHLYSFFLMLGASMTQPLSLRKQLWTEKQDCLKLIRLRADHVQPWSLDMWTQPMETDVTVLMAMFQTLLQKIISQEYNSVLYEIARTQLKRMLDSNTNMNPELSKFRSFLAKERDHNDEVGRIFK